MSNQIGNQMSEICSTKTGTVRFFLKSASVNENKKLEDSTYEN